MSSVVTPVARSRARCGARSTPRLIWSERIVRSRVRVGVAVSGAIEARLPLVIDVIRALAGAPRQFGCFPHRDPLVAVAAVSPRTLILVCGCPLAELIVIHRLFSSP